MWKLAIVALAVAVGVALLGVAGSPPAIANAPKCKDKSNRYVACTDRRGAGTPARKKKKDGWIEVDSVAQPTTK